MTDISQRRLRDGAAALAAPTNLSVMSKEDLDELRAALVNGVLALQSLDDLGSMEANDAAWRDMEELQKRVARVDEALANITQEIEPMSKGDIKKMFDSPDMEVIDDPDAPL